MEKKLYRWLPIIFGCHCRKDRSFFWKGKQFPICARCTGELAGIFITTCTYFFFHCSELISIILLIPLILDGFIQKFTSYESNNFTRFLTGLLFGFGFASLLFWSFSFVIGKGYLWGQHLRNLYLVKMNERMC